MHSPTASIYMKVGREDEVSCSIAIISSRPSFWPPVAFLWSRKGWAEFAGICRNLFEPTNSLFWREPRTLIGGCSFWAPNSKQKHATAAFRPLAQSPNYLLPMSWHHILLAIPLLYGEYNFLPNVVLPDPGFL